MTATLIALALAAAPPAPDLGASAPPTAAEAPRAATSGSGPGVAVPALVLAGLGAAALLLARRRARTSRFVQVLETTSLGQKRSLVVARLGNDLLLLGASEAGIALLSTQPATDEAHAAADAAAAQVPPPLPAPPREESASGAGLLGRLHLRPRAVPGPVFEALLADSTDDQDLRRKLARGRTGSVR